MTIDAGLRTVSDLSWLAYLDDGIRPFVEILNRATPRIETFESCEGGDGHTFPEPTIRFHGQHDEGFRALALVLCYHLPVRALRRVWVVLDGEPVGPHWELTFHRKANEVGR